MTILITGATGYIGQELVRRLQNKYHIIALVRKSSNQEELEKLECQIISFTKYKEIIEIFKSTNIDGIIHCASSVVVEHTTDDIDGLIESNILLGTYLLEASKYHKKIWFINTGTFWQHYENREYSPVNLYASTKESFEKIAQYYTETTNLIFTTIELNDTFGPNDKRKKVFNLWKDVSKTDEKLDMSLGEQIIDMSFIEDILNAYQMLINHLNSDRKQSFQNKKFIVTSNDRMTLKEMSKVYEKVSNTKLNIQWGGREYRDREVMVPYNRGEVVPGWKQEYSFEEALYVTINQK